MSIRRDPLRNWLKRWGLTARCWPRPVKNYNGYCETGVDEEFGKDAKYLVPVTGETYYGIVGSSYCYSTCGGLDINTKFQVLKADGETPIEGLYAVGTDCMGVLFSETKAYVTYGGAAQGWAYTSGPFGWRYCGRSAERVKENHDGDANLKRFASFLRATTYIDGKVRMDVEEQSRIKMGWNMKEYGRMYPTRFL